MKRTSNLLIALLTPLVFVWSVAADAASCTNGKTLFTKTTANQTMACADSLCHKSTVSANNIGRGAQNPGVIDSALSNIEEMADVRKNLNLSASDIDDLALWIFFGNAGQPCPTGTTPPPAAATVDVVEYFHAAFGHYFITYLTDEIAKLDNGTFVGWARTGKQFKAWTAAGTDLSPVCRFFTTAFAPKSSHFYTPFAPECSVVKANAVWSYEGEVFFTQQASVTGVCPPNTLPVYRMYNNGQSGAPNHRYTTDFNVRAQMLAQGWIPEGAGTIGVIMCSPP
ncbi:MAG: hypothetical protein ABI777_03905 [Betaproteobacteria bacterium]